MRTTIEFQIKDKYIKGERNFRQINLSHTSFSGANFSGADLEATDLFDADLKGADLKPIWDDLRKIIIPNIGEINYLYLTLKEGKFQTTPDRGPRLCRSSLSEILAHGATENLPKSILASRDPSRPIESFFKRIWHGDSIYNSWDCQQVVQQLKLIVQEQKTVLPDGFYQSLDKGLKSRKICFWR